MGLFDRLKAELIDIIEWIDDSQHTLVWRFPRHQNEIKNGAQLIVRPGQTAILVSQGKLADVFTPGQYELNTPNMPILSTLQGWKYGFESPFKCEVYFISTKQITDLKWGTPNPIMMRDPEFGPIRIRAFGTYALKVDEPVALLTEMVGTDGDFGADDVTELLRSMIVSSFADMLGKREIPALDLAANYRELSEALRKDVVERIDDEYGLNCPQLFIVNIAFPEAVEKALDTRTSMGLVGDMNKFQQFQTGQAITAAAENPAGGGAADGLGLGMGLAMANRMMAPGAQPQAMPGYSPAPAPPPPPAAPAWHVASQGQTLGPYAFEQLAASIAAGEINGETLVWTAGMQAWTRADQVPQLASYLQASAPPPPPPPPA